MLNDTLQEQFAPFGYVPVEARGMPAVQLSLEGQKRLTVPLVGDQDLLDEALDASGPVGDRLRVAPLRS
mgnify:CR=1 FL=1